MAGVEGAAREDGGELPVLAVAEEAAGVDAPDVVAAPRLDDPGAPAVAEGEGRELARHVIVGLDPPVDGGGEFFAAGDEGGGAAVGFDEGDGDVEGVDEAVAGVLQVEDG